MRRVCLVVVATLSTVPCASFGQPAGPTEPTSYIDLGMIALGDSIDSGEVDLPLDKFLWFRFELTEGITPQTGWMDMDTLGPNVITNCELGLYDNQKNFIASDNDSAGSGPSGTNFAAAMSFGAGSGLRATLDPLGGTLSDGRSSGNLSAGIYWAVVAGYDATFSDPNNFWIVDTTSSATGKVRLKITTGEPSPGYWNERWNGGDAGILPSDAMVVRGTGDLTTIMCALSDGPRAVDMLQIRVCDPATFRVESQASTIDADEGGGGSWGTRLYLFDSESRPVLGVNRTTNNGNTVLEPLSPTQLAPGDYYLAVTTNCNGANGWEASPYGEGGAMFVFGGVASNQTITPNGPGAGQPVQFWGRVGNCNNAASFIARLDLAGACYIDDSCPADLNGDGQLNFFDVQIYLNQYSQGCP